MNIITAIVPNNNQTRNYGGWLLILVVLVLAAPFLGVIAGTGNLLLIGYFGLFVAIVLLGASPGALLWICVLGGLVVSGLLELYFPKLQVLRWAFAGATILLPISVVARNMMSREAPLLPMPALFYWAMAFLLLSLVTTFVHWRGVGAAIFGWKSYFQVWGLLIGLALLRQSPSLFNSLPKTMLLIGLIQLPFALHQFIILAPQRIGLQHGIVPVDIVVGTFGASLLGGGANAALAVFQIFLASVIMALLRTGALRRYWALILAGILLLPIYINESKISVVYVLLSFLIIFRTEIIQRPLRFFAMFGLISVTVAGLIFSYVALHESSKYKAPMALLEHVIEQNTQEGVGYGTYSLNRVTTLNFWIQEQGRYSLLDTLLGHGLGESRDERGLLDLSQTMAASRYAGMGIGLTTISSLLWDVGVLGLVLVLGMFVSAFRLAGKLAHIYGASQWSSGWFQGIQAGIAILLISLAHKNFFVYHLEFQTFIFLVMGYLIHTARHVALDSRLPANKHRPWPIAHRLITV